MTMLVSSVALRMWHKDRERRRLAEHRRAEGSTAHHASAFVRNREDRERWGDIDLGGLHPLNRDEVQRLLRIADADGVSALSSRDRLFLDNMTLPRSGT